MALLSEASKEKKFDVRITQRSIIKGQLSREELEKNVKSLSDDTAHADYVNTETLLESVKSLKATKQ